jgi:putative nucleotidyltransferase with HDIG domain
MLLAHDSNGERRRKAWFGRMLGGVKTHLKWPELLIGAVAAILIAGLLLGFKFQAIPEYKIGDIAGQHVIAPQEILYEDKQETANRRETARDKTPALYELDTSRFADLEGKIHLAFNAARQVLSAQRIPSKGRLNRIQQKTILGLLDEEIGQIIPPRFLSLLLKQRFDPTLEKKIFALLGPVLRGGIVADPEVFRQDVKKGIVLRDKETMTERLLGDSSRVRSLEEAKEHLRQFHLEFADLSAPERAELFAFLDTLLIPTLFYNVAETEARRSAAAARVTPVEVQIKKGKVILRTGEEVTPRAAADLAALGNLRRPTPLLQRFLALFFFVASFLYILWRYFTHFHRSYRKITSRLVLVALVMVLFVLVMRLLTSIADILGEHFPLPALQDPFGLYFAIPFPFAAMLATLLVDLNVGLLVSMVTSALAGLFYGDIYLAVYALLGSLIGTYAISQYRERLGLAKSGLWIGIVNVIAAFGVHWLRQDIFVWSDLLTTTTMGALSGTLAVVLCSLFLPALEFLFKVTTDIRLVELSNLNLPTLKRLSVEAPGTYHHSLMVGTLAEAAAEAIGANSLLVRVAAYYHDIGKMLNPDYFTENQSSGLNRHESIPPSVSCLVLSNHVKDGLALAREAGLMETVRDMIPQHHGTRIMTYFYQKAKESAGANGQEIMEGDFRYAGPKPQTKEAAILLTADCIEAASRTLSNPFPLQIQGLIDRLIDGILADNQLDECDITMREIRLVKESFLKVLTGIHHRRIDYPGFEFPAQETGKEGQS